jgi:hypothetical protein
MMAAAKASGCIAVADMMHAGRGPLDNAARVLAHADSFIPNETKSAAPTGLTNRPQSLLN